MEKLSVADFYKILQYILDNDHKNLSLYPLIKSMSRDSAFNLKDSFWSQIKEENISCIQNVISAMVDQGTDHNAVQVNLFDDTGLKATNSNVLFNRLQKTEPIVPQKISSNVSQDDFVWLVLSGLVEFDKKYAPIKEKHSVFSRFINSLSINNHSPFKIFGISSLAFACNNLLMTLPSIIDYGICFLTPNHNHSSNAFLGECQKEAIDTAAAEIVIVDSEMTALFAFYYAYMLFISRKQYHEESLKNTEWVNTFFNSMISAINERIRPGNLQANNELTMHNINDNDKAIFLAITGLHFIRDRFPSNILRYYQEIAESSDYCACVVNVDTNETTPLVLPDNHRSRLSSYASTSIVPDYGSTFSINNDNCSNKKVTGSLWTIFNKNKQPRSTSGNLGERESLVSTL